jgi:predicted DNA-binding transcriptional regulator YafY
MIHEGLGMRRADRLFQIVQQLRGRRLTTARFLADRLQVSERTIYRDVQDLQLSGVPVEGEAGVGYVLRKGFDLPPLMFDREELEALVVGARMVQAWGGDALSDAARQALVKIEHVLPADRRREIRRSRLFALNFHLPAQLAQTMDVAREAINQHRLLRLDYRREDGAASVREVRPLALYFWGSIWTLAAWCELRRDFRSFRVDRIAAAQLLEQRFEEETGKTLEDFIARVAGD